MSLEEDVSSTPQGEMPPPEDVPAPPAEHDDTDELTGVRRTACFRLFRENVAHFGIDYKDGDDLYASLMRKLDKLHIPSRKMYFLGAYEDHFEINNAETVEGLALDNHVVTINVCAEDDDERSCSDDSELAEESPRRKHQKCTSTGNCHRSRWAQQSRSCPHSRAGFPQQYCSCGCHSYFPGLHHEPSLYHHPFCYQRQPPLPFSIPAPFHVNSNPRLQLCPFFGMRQARGNHRCNGWQGGYYGY